MDEFGTELNFEESLEEAIRDFEEKSGKKFEEHEGDVELKEGLFENTCTGEIFVDLQSKSLIIFPWQNYIDFKNLVVNIKIKYICLTDNNIKEIDGKMFAAFPNLDWLDLRDNRLSSFPKEVQNHPNLNTILLDNNKITELPLELGSLPKLQELSIFGNPITFPSKKILQLNENELVNYFKRCWKEQTHEVPLREQAPTERKKFTKTYTKMKLKPIEDVATFVSRKMKSRNVVDQVFAESVIKIVEKQNNILQKKKDTEALKEWRERYTLHKSLPVIKTMDVPPYGTYERYSRMPNRKDVKDEFNFKTKAKVIAIPKRKRREQLTQELKKLQEAMNGMQSHPMPTVMDANSVKEAMASRIEELKALREIKKKIGNLKLKTFN